MEMGTFGLAGVHYVIVGTFQVGCVLSVRRVRLLP